MIEGYSPVIQAFLGTIFTWGVTALGASLVWLLKGSYRRSLDASLGFASGVMLAASYWSLLKPALEMAENGSYGKWSFIPVAVGFLVGAGFVCLADVVMNVLGVSSDPALALAFQQEDKAKVENGDYEIYTPTRYAPLQGFGDPWSNQNHLKQRGASLLSSYDDYNVYSSTTKEDKIKDATPRFRRICLLIIAITIHNIPEGLAVGVGFGAIGQSSSATFQSARNLAIGIALQNFPEGLAVSLPLKGAGFSNWRSFWYGQLSGIVEPIAGVLGAWFVSLAEPLLPYALAFAAGAMIYVVFDDLVPEAQSSGNGRLASWGAMVGFVLMMSLDVGLG